MQSIERAFTVLACIRAGAAGVSEIAQGTGLPKSTVSRLLLTLADVGAVEVIPSGHGYRIGPVLYDLGTSVGPRRSIIDVARPFLIELTRLTGEAAGLSVLAGNKSLCVESIESHTDIQVRDWTGVRADPYLGSGGLVLLSGLTIEAVAAVCPEPLNTPTPFSISTLAELHARLVVIRREGHGWAVNEFVDGLTSVAAPVHDRKTGLIIAAVHVHGPSFRFPGAATKELVDQVTAAASRITALLHKER